jgi:hypothetical protein
MRRKVSTMILGAAALAAVAVTAAATATAGSGAKAAPSLAQQLALAHDATAKYVDGLGRAKADGYGILTRMIPSMGYHFINPKVTGFDVRKPPILVYLHHGSSWRLGALEWVFPQIPATPPLPGAKYGAFGAACHYVDGTVVFADDQAKCAPTAPTTGAKFNFWHGPLVTMHVWLWYPNPAGLFAGTNPFATPFDRG